MEVASPSIPVIDPDKKKTKKNILLSEQDHHVHHYTLFCFYQSLPLAQSKASHFDNINLVVLFSVKETFFLICD